MKNIETNIDRLKQQQAVLALLGFYSGVIDGIWSAESISAKRQYEASGKFTGGIPNQGLPFDPSAPLPAPLFRDPRNGLVCHPELTGEKLQELMSRGAKVQSKTKPESAPEQTGSKDTEPAESNDRAPAKQTTETEASAEKPRQQQQPLSKKEKRRLAIQQQNS